MPRWFVRLCLAGGLALGVGCNDELVEDVPKDVCYSEKRWIGDKRGSPEMFPGRDCVGCHIDNDGPPLAIGGTLYPYILRDPELSQVQSGEDCFGIEGIVVTIEDADGQVFEVTTNRAGNFYVEGNPEDFAKPFTAGVFGWGVNGDGVPLANPMSTTPVYGGCGRCHSPGAELVAPGEGIPPDEVVIPAGAPIGLPAYSPDGPGGLTVENELRGLAGIPPR